MNLLTALIGPVTDIARGYLFNKAEEKQAKHKAKLNVIQNDADWEAKMAEASGRSWKSQFWTIVLAIPIVMIGYASVSGDMTVVHRTKQAFQALEELPEWYQGLLVLAVSSSFGRKVVSTLVGFRGPRK